MLDAKERPRTTGRVDHTEEDIVADVINNGSSRSDLQRIIRYIHNEEGARTLATKDWIDRSIARRNELQQLQEMNDEEGYTSAVEQIKDFEGQLLRLARLIIDPGKEN